MLCMPTPSLVSSPHPQHAPTDLFMCSRPASANIHGATGASPGDPNHCTSFSRCLSAHITPHHTCTPHSHKLIHTRINMSVAATKGLAESKSMIRAVCTLQYTQKVYLYRVDVDYSRWTGPLSHPEDWRLLGHPAAESPSASSQTQGQGCSEPVLQRQGCERSRALNCLRVHAFSTRYAHTLYCINTATNTYSTHYTHFTV